MLHTNKLERHIWGLGQAFFLILFPVLISAQERDDRSGEWRYIGADAAHTRYSPLEQINADNFEDLEVAWVWRGDNYGPRPLAVSR